MRQLESPQEKPFSIKSSQARQQTYQSASFDYERIDGGKELELLNLSLLIPKRLEPVASTGSILLDSLMEDHASESSLLHDLNLIEISAFHPLDPSSQEHIELQEYRDYLEQNYFQTAKSYPKPPGETSGDKSTGAISQNLPTSSHPPTEPKSNQPSAEQAAIFIAADGPAARSSAASVGLLDINDALLFGGVYRNLFSVDPHMTQGDDDSVYILTYLLRHLSAFTVTQLQNGFPNSADPAVINQPDSTKYLTVLEISDFILDDLDSIDELDSPETPTAEEAQLKASNTKSESEGLSEQVQSLMEEIELLNQKLEQITTS